MAKVDTGPSATAGNREHETTVPATAATAAQERQQMNPVRFVSITLLLIIMALSGRGRAEAFWGFGEDHDLGKSGLDFNRGYDVNTVATVTGRVVATQRSGSQGHVIIEIRSDNETINICVGPGSYWDKKGTRIRTNDEISAKGSRAQGKDGKSYLLAQTVINRTTGAQVELRNEKGRPGWLSSDTSPDSPSNGRGFQGGGMMRGNGGGMMRGNGGMMRR